MKNYKFLILFGLVMSLAACNANGDNSSSIDSSSSGTSQSSSGSSGSSSSSSSSSSSQTGGGDVTEEVRKYYQGVDLTLSGTALKSALYNKIKGHTTLGYSSLNNHMKKTDRDWNLSPNASDSNPYMVLIYASYNFNTSSAKKWDTNNAVWDKEHIWAKAHGNFGTSNGAGSDLHHLRASDKTNNNGRDNYDFGNANVVSKNIKDFSGVNSGKLGTQTGFTKTIYEPLDIYKGDVARACFYMATRYSTGTPTLNLVNNTTGVSGSPGSLGIVSTLLQWNVLDPVDEFELNRNTLVQDLQHNRNPFIDYPELASRIWG